LEYASYVPASVSAIAVDTAGNFYFTGSDIQGVAFPTTPGAFQSSRPNAVQNAVVGRLNAAGSALVYGTYLSGAQGISRGNGIALDSAGNVLVGGATEAADFPATEGQPFNNATGGNVFLAKFTPAGVLIYSAFLGPGGAFTVNVAPNGNIYLGCLAESADVPSPSLPFGGTAPTIGEGYYLFLVSADGSTLLNTIYLPFSVAVAVDNGGNADVLGQGIVSTTAGAFQSSLSNYYDQVVVAKIAPDGQLAGATYTGTFGGTLIAAERDGSVVVAGGNTVFNFFPSITIENAASYVTNTAVPGEIVAIQGYGIGPAVGVTSAPTAGLGGVRVYFDNFAAPVMYAQANQLNVQVPWEIAGQSTTRVQIQYLGAPAGSVSLAVSPALPGVFFIVNSDGAFNSPANPARPGDFVAIYGTGGGAMSPAGITGGTWPLTPLCYLTQSVSAAIGTESAQVLYGGSAPTLGTGFFQINVLLPSDLPSGAQTLSVAVGGVASVPVAISIQ
jgi:uncharacterized protein (TIGR03437 family)